MSKHDFHISLLIIALIVAGVIVHQLVNDELGIPGKSSIVLNIDKLTTYSSSDSTIGFSPSLLKYQQVDSDKNNTAKSYEHILLPWETVLNPPDSLIIEITHSNNQLIQ